MPRTSPSRSLGAWSATRWVAWLWILALLGHATPGEAATKPAVPHRAAVPTPDSTRVAHVVCRGETLEDIGERYGVPVPAIRAWNGLGERSVHSGQRLVIWTRSSRGVDEYQLLEGEAPPNEGADPEEAGELPEPAVEFVHVVQPGESLSVLADRYRTSVRALRALNGIDGTKILAGQELRLHATPRATHVVEPGDALWEIARAYDMSTAEIKTLNDLRSDRIFPGQVLKLAPDRTATVDEYVVRKDESLADIAQLHQMSVLELQELNGLHGTKARPGQRLHVRPILGRSAAQPAAPSERGIDWNALTLSVPEAKLRSAENGPYYGKRPKASYQRDQRYVEDATGGNANGAFVRARRLFDGFAAKVDAMAPRSKKLAGWHIVLDPGHGGIDPGSITRVLDGRGNPVYVVEDEYVYDIVLRMYVLLRLHGADVTLTLLSPNHLVRQSNPATRTFVHERNEVYNSPAFNPEKGAGHWPKGGRLGLTARVEVAAGAFTDVPKSRRLFLSVHADNSPDRPAVPIVLYYASSKREDQASKKFAKALLPALGAGAESRGRNLAVLRRNAADASVLVEIRNVAHADHAWALRFEELRQRDAEKIVQGILDYVASK